MNFYLDASVIVPLFVKQATSAAIEAWALAADGRLLVSDLTAAEFASALSRMVRKREMAQEATPVLHLAFEDWRRDMADPVENLPADIRLAARLVRTPFPRLLTPDAIHLATCKRLDLVLVTHDDALREIAAREGVAVVAFKGIGDRA